MKKLLILLLLCLSVTVISQQLTVYKTYEDYVNKRGIAFDSLSHYSNGLKNIKIFVYSNGKKETIKCKDIYGYLLDSTLFRVYREHNIPVRLMVANSIYYYSGVTLSVGPYKTTTEIPVAGSDRDISKTSYSPGYDIKGREFFSLSLSGELYELPDEVSPGKMKRFNKRITELKRQFPEYKTLFQCISATAHRYVPNDDMGLPYNYKWVFPRMFMDCFTRYKP